MAEKRRQRANKIKKGVGLATTATTRLKERLPPPTVRADQHSKPDATENAGGEKKQQIHVANPEAAATKAQELLQAQRDSVNMLTRVRECVEKKLSDTSN